MRIQATTGKAKEKTLTKHVYKLTLTANDDAEEQALAKLHRKIRQFGIVEIAEQRDPEKIPDYAIVSSVPSYVFPEARLLHPGENIND